ncbi:hypothetical protein ACEF39_001316 [Stenotrophomonas indicatrix]
MGAATGAASTRAARINATLSSVDASRTGIASGVLNSARQVGGMLGVAVFGYLIRDTAPQAFMRGMHVSIGISVALLLFGTILCWLGHPTRSLHGLMTPLQVPPLSSRSWRDQQTY